MPFGVTQQMIDTYGETIFRLSLNKQVRHGDAVRELDFERIEAARADTGLTDDEIAGRIGLLTEQVSVVRVFVERKYHRIDQHRRLFALGGGKRWKKENYKNPVDRLRIRKEGMMLREALNFDPGRAAYYLENGYWINETMAGWLADHAGNTPDAPAIERLMARRGSPGRLPVLTETFRQATRLEAALWDMGMHAVDRC